MSRHGHDPTAGEPPRLRRQPFGEVNAHRAYSPSQFAIGPGQKGEPTRSADRGEAPSLFEGVGRAEGPIYHPRSGRQGRCDDLGVRGADRVCEEQQRRQALSPARPALYEASGRRQAAQPSGNRRAS